MIFTEAVSDVADFERFRATIDIPLLANMTEFGKSPLLTAQQLAGIGYNAVIYPVTTLRLAMFAIEAGLREIESTGTQSGLLDRMQHRSRLYAPLGYEKYNEFDTQTYNFTLKETAHDSARH